jgi:2-dehydro-3-deoxygalactonokinase
MEHRLDTAEGLIAIDWGTTNRRVYRLDPAGGRQDLIEDGMGVLSVPRGGFLAEMESLRLRCGAGPMLLAGMVGSNRGWIETDYVPVPATLDDLARAIRWAAPDIGIVPGVAWTAGGADVMRGEEVQLLGALASGAIAPGAAICHPGTHAKWMRLDGAALGRFRTVMTGELFSLLQRDSILADLLAAPAADGPAFRAGVDHALAHCDIPAELFAVRARHLLEDAAPDWCAAYASGLLIGADVRIGLNFCGGDDPVAVIGRPDLVALYAAALARAGRAATRIDGEDAFADGMRALAERLR